MARQKSSSFGVSDDHPASQRTTGAAAMSDEPLEWVLALIKGEDDGIQ